MMTKLLAIDQGTTGSTALVCDSLGHILGRTTVELPQHYPRPGWVEHDPAEMIASVERAIDGALEQSRVNPRDLAAIGITNQRETTLVWERASGTPVHRAIVWQDRRTAAICDGLRHAGHEPAVRARTGLVLDPYFSASKVAWILDHCPETRSRAEQGELLFGTVDSYLVWRLAGGMEHKAPHVVEASNASRTSLMDLRSLQWDPWLCELFRVPEAVLPRIVPTVGPIAETRRWNGLPDGIPITAIAGDQQAALFGQGCVLPGQSKCTYGTGAFVVVNTGANAIVSQHGLLSTVAWQVGEQVVYALEGSCFAAGAAVQWLRDGLGIIESADEVQALAARVDSSEGVVFVPALAGMGAPHWDPLATGCITGLTRGTGPAHIARATLEGIAWQVEDLLGAMRLDIGDDAITALRVDGGAARNNLLLQIQSDLSHLRVVRSQELESTGRGAALLAGVGAGLIPSVEKAAELCASGEEFQPKMSAPDVAAHRQLWRSAVARTLYRPESGA